jgi:hypothetical protein
MEEAMASSLGQKLQIKPGVPITVVNAPDDVKNRLPGELPENPLSFNPAGSPSALLIFVKTKAEVENSALPLLQESKQYAPVWLLYPKGTSGVATDVSRDILWKMLEPYGWGPARMIALDEIWSAMRFTPIKK